ncbi:uncharacterized protein RHOBADRAFT_35922 [Rhodotorula graminis WP1]|uniref:Acetolactate synthase, mitochondrial n=1 Tax=Rhodotorula graminis (strain WP1) TaxID=578459 RepID=A0A194S5Y9_RHOGW|nr:uncharacterized protein RHOBADRAFT_35922 [Rhodotorula graminis WP1]KPV76143.1 hypothetical protein RHOBADRAFT_35922 [Rhodotorula graminis WP1]
MMLRHKVEKVFGYPGGAILPVFDAIYNSPHFDFVLPRHEQGAGHMAEGYARVSGKPGVVLVTSGPGATNVITPLQDALSDGTPLVVFCGQVATSAIGSDAFQEADVVGISRSCTKWNVMVKDIAELPRRINEAFRIATTGRPGPVLVDLPKDVTAAILRQAIPHRYTHPELADATIPGRSHSHTATSALGGEATPISDALLNKAAHMIANAKRPVIYAGQGMLSTSEGPELLKRLAKEGNIPVTTTLMGLGAYDELDETHSLHMLGMHGSAYANLAMQSADVIIALGARFDDRVTGRLDMFAPAAKAAALQGRGGIIHFEVQPKNINKVVNANVAITGDVLDSVRALLPLLPSEAQPRDEWFAKIKQWKADYPFTYVPSDPSRRAHEAPGDLFYEKRYSHTAMTNPDFVALAKAMGVHAIRCDSVDELPAKMKEFMEYDNQKPVLFEARVVKSEHVFPMIPAGKALHQLMLHPSLKPVDADFAK